MIIDNGEAKEFKPNFEPLSSNTVPRTFKPEKIFAVNRRELPVNSGISVHVDYVNNTGKPIYLKSQAGITTNIPPNLEHSFPRRTDAHLEIRITTTISRLEGVRVTTSLLEENRRQVKVTPMTHDASVFLDGLLSEQMTEGRGRGSSTFSQTNVISLPYSQLAKIEAMYLRETDTLVSIHPSLVCVPHPNSSEGIAAMDVGRIKATPGHVGIIVRAVDNEGLVGRRYMFSGKDVIVIPTFEDETMESGVYITTMNSDRDGNITRTTQRYTYEEAERDHGIYRTREHAITSGDPRVKLEHDTEQLKVMGIEKKVVEIDRKSEESQAAHDLKMMENRWAAFLTAQKQQSSELERAREERHQAMLKEIQEKALLTDRIRQLEKEALESKAVARKDYYESRSRERDDYYENRSSQRKDYSEILKYVPAFIMGIAGAFAIFRYGGGGKSSANYVY